MSITKRCEVCGGKVTPIDGQSPFGSCDSCGIAYALKVRPEGIRSYETPKSVVLQSDVETKDADTPQKAAVVDTEDFTESFKSRWRCPDCGTVLNSANESDLEFLKREHIREYHPNRSS